MIKGRNGVTVMISAGTSDLDRRKRNSGWCHNKRSPRHFVMRAQNFWGRRIVHQLSCTNPKHATMTLMRSFERIPIKSQENSLG